MKQIRLKIFVVHSLSVKKIKDYVERNYGTFSIFYQTFEYNKNIDKWRLIVDSKTEPLSSFVVSLRSEWLSSSFFYDEYNNIKHFLKNINDRPF